MRRNLKRKLKEIKNAEKSINKLMGKKEKKTLSKPRKKADRFEKTNKETLVKIERIKQAEFQPKNHTYTKISIFTVGK